MNASKKGTLRRLIAFPLTLLSLLCLSAPSAYALQWYEIDMVVFANLTETWKSSEVWAPPSTEHLNYIESAIPFEEAETLNPESFQRKRISDDRSAIISGLDRGGLYRPLFSATWHQPIYSKNRATPFIIQGGEPFDARHELEGTIKLSLGRYLHIETDLRLNEFMQRSEARERGLLPTETALVGPLKPVEDHLASQSDYTRLDQPYNYTPYTSLPYNNTPYDASEARTEDRDSLFQGRYIRDPRLSEFEFVAIKSYAMQQTRRMRSAELHYIDHPGFGLLIKIKKVEAPTPSALSPIPPIPPIPPTSPTSPTSPTEEHESEIL